MNNGLIELQVVPEIGGRVIQYRLGDYDYFWVNKELFGKKPPASGLGPNGEWLNYGGDKLWIAPQGWDNDQQWPGPPDAVLDGGPYTPQVVKRGDDPVIVKLTSPPDKRSGVQISRTVSIYNNTSHVKISVGMTNIDTKPRRWGFWPHTQFDAGNRYGSGYNKNYWGYCPIGPNTVFPKGYTVMFGDEKNPTFQPDYDEKMMKVHYRRKVGKIGLDSKAGWVATVDATNGYAFIQRFKYHYGKQYPDDSSVEFWTNGLGKIKAYGKVIKMPKDPKKNPYVFESEIVSPYIELEPGRSEGFHYDWYAAKIGKNMPVVNFNRNAAICKPVSFKMRGDRLFFEGRYGVFGKGFLQILFLGSGLQHLEKIQCAQPIGPLQPLDLSKVPELSKGIILTSDIRFVAVLLTNEKGKMKGEIDFAEIPDLL
jgi:hypothetical protein